MKKIVIITDHRSADARSAGQYLQEKGYQVETVPETVCLWDEKALQAWAEPFGADVCAVIHPAPPVMAGGVLEVSETDWSLARDEGPMAAWCVTKVFGGIFREKKQGVLIYLNSIHAEKPVGNGMLFSMGCGAVQMLCREANQDYGTDGVRCYFIQRGIQAGDPDLRSNVSNVYFGTDLRYPERKMPACGQLNGLIGFLLTEEAAVLSGADLRADGGMTMFYNHRSRVEGRPYYDPKPAE